MLTLDWSQEWRLLFFFGKACPSAPLPVIYVDLARLFGAISGWGIKHHHPVTPTGPLVPASSTHSRPTFLNGFKPRGPIGSPPACCCRRSTNASPSCDFFDSVVFLSTNQSCRDASNGLLRDCLTARRSATGMPRISAL